MFQFLKHLAGFGDHLGELGRGVFYLGGTVEELLVVDAGLFIVLEDVGVGIGDVEIGGDGGGIIGEMLLPGDRHSPRAACR